MQSFSHVFSQDIYEKTFSKGHCEKKLTKNIGPTDTFSKYSQIY